MGRRGRPVDDATRTRVRELHAEGKSRNAIARTLGLSGSTVSGIIASVGATFDRSATVAATEAKVADTDAARAQLSAELIADAARLRRQLWEPVTIGAFGGKDNVWTDTRLPEPTFADKRAILASVHSAIRDHLDLERADASDGTGEARGVLGEIMDGIRAAYTQQQADATPESV